MNSDVEESNAVNGEQGFPILGILGIVFVVVALLIALGLCFYIKKYDRKVTSAVSPGEPKAN